MNAFGGRDIEDLMPGMHASFTKTISAQDIDGFARVSGDDNALHLNEDYARLTRFGGRIAHGMLTGSLISAALAKHLPGPGAVYLSQQLEFLAPVRPGDSVTATVTVSAVDRAAARVALSTTCHVGARLVLQGEARLKTTSRNPANAHHD